MNPVAVAAGFCIGARVCHAITKIPSKPFDAAIKFDKKNAQSCLEQMALGKRFKAQSDFEKAVELVEPQAQGTAWFPLEQVMI